MENNDNLDADWHNLLFDVRRSVRYHDRRVKFFSHTRRLFAALMLLGGLGGFYMVLFTVHLPGVGVIASIVTATLAALAIELELGRYMHQHNNLKRRFIRLEQALVMAKRSADHMARFTAARLAIEADEPPVLRNLDTLCHNEMVRAGGYGAEHEKPLTWWQRWSASILDLDADRAAALR